MSKELKGIDAAIARALAKDPVYEVLSLLIGHFVGLTVELASRRGADETKPITLTSGDQRDITIHPPKDSPAKPPKREMLLGRKLFQFPSKTFWINVADQCWKANNVHVNDTTCVDKLGRICTTGLHFAEAERDNAYPIEVYMTRPEPEPAVEGGAA